MHAVIELVAFLVGGMKMFVVVTFLVFVEEISLLLVTGSAFWHSSLTVSIIHNYFAITVTTICTGCRLKSSFSSAVPAFLKQQKQFIR